MADPWRYHFSLAPQPREQDLHPSTRRKARSRLRVCSHNRQSTDNLSPQAKRRTLRSTAATSPPMANVWSRLPVVRPTQLLLLPLSSANLYPFTRWLRAHLVHRGHLQWRKPKVRQAPPAGLHELPFRHHSRRSLFPRRQVPRFRCRRQDRVYLFPRP